MHHTLVHSHPSRTIVASLVFDGELRLSRLEWRDGVRNTIDRYHDGDDVVLEKRRVGQGNQQYARYIHGPNADQPLAMELYPTGAQPVPGAGQKFYYHADGEGSVRLVTDAVGQIANRYKYPLVRLE